MDERDWDTPRGEEDGDHVGQRESALVEGKDGGGRKGGGAAGIPNVSLGEDEDEDVTALLCPPPGP